MGCVEAQMNMAENRVEEETYRDMGGREREDGYMYFSCFYKCFFSFNHHSGNLMNISL
ncbi:hypothetical protein ACJIZ3_010832 [Penstemon smallii]|uniref:Uncharacterized protein n=1 Tax=Penstemon smallii TaxID=265156 RepID=A0ABD3UL00_9LAMI